MTLSRDMMAQIEQSSIDAVRLTLELTFKDIQDLTGAPVVLEISQQECLSARMNEAPLTEGPDAFRVWRWITQGARARDTQGMKELLRLATAAAEAVRVMDRSSQMVASTERGVACDQEATKVAHPPSHASATKKAKP